MKRIKIYVSMLLIMCMALSVPAQAAVNRTQEKEQTAAVDRTDSEKAYAEGQAMILYRESASTKSSLSANSLGADMQIEETYEFGDADAGISAQARKSSRAASSQTLKVSLVKSDIYTTEELIKRLGARKDILAAEPNYRIHLLNQDQDPYAKFQWALDNQGQNHGTKGLDVNPEQEILGTSPEKECVIALVDTGIDYTHEDLKNVVWTNPIQSNKLRGAHGYDFINYDTDPMDDNGHGTHCSGIMAAEWNNGGIRGIANNSKVKIMALKILDEEGSGYGMEAVGAYNYIYKAQQLGINVVAVNNSWGGMEEEESVIVKTLIDLVGEKGAVSVCAAGNNGETNDFLGEEPASLDSKYIISVAASNENDELAAFSNYGSESVDIAAPGTDILSSVSYDCFNPGIYENPGELCKVYEDFSDGNLVQNVTADDGDIAYGYAKNNGKAEVSLGLSDEAYFGLQGSREKSLKWTINGAREGGMYTIYFPYMAGVSNTDSYDSIMVKAVGPDSQEEIVLFESMLLVCDMELAEDGSLEMENELDLLSECIGGVSVDKGNYWSHISGVAHPACKEIQRRALAVTLVALQEGNYEIYMDDMGVSKENTASEKFGRYDYYNGTSMATPYVTGAVAAIACAYPQEDALDRVQHVLGCTRKSSALDGKVVTGGVLDLAKVAMPNAYIRNVSLDDSKNIRIEGRGLSGAAVTINNQAVTPKDQSENEIILESAGLWNKTLNITVTVGEKELNWKCFFAEGAGFEDIGKTYGMLGGGDIVSDGEQIYYVDFEGMVASCNPNQKDELEDIFWMDGYLGYSTKLFGLDDGLAGDSAFISNLSDVICLDNKLWTILQLDQMFSVERILAYYDDSDGGWKAAGKLPEKFEDLEGISIAAYQGELYLLGGLDTAAGVAQTHVMKMDPLTMKWEEGIALPEARAFAKAVSTGNKLVLTLGKNEAGSFPYNMVFDGKSWSVSKAKLEDFSANDVYFYLDANSEEKEAPYYSGSVGAVEGGLIYTGLEVENLGDTFYYQLESDRYAAAGYALSNTSIKKETDRETVVVHDKLYLLASEDEDIHIYAMPVQSACIEVFDSDKDEDDDELSQGYLTGVRHYVPGDVINVTPQPEEGCFVKQFMVDGVKVEKGADGKYQYRAVVDTAKKKIPVSVKYGNYVLYIEMENELSLYPGQEYYLMPEVFPENADNRKLIWSIDKPGIISRDKNSGLLKVSTKAKPGDKVVITATAADRKEIKTSCKITITSVPLPEKNDVYPSGKLMFKVTASSAKKKTVACTGFSDKSVQTVKIPDTVKINGYTFMVTEVAKNAFTNDKKIKSVVIGKNVTTISQGAFQNCKSLNMIQIKGTALKTVGKNAFKGIDKKATASVPKKQKKAYTSKLKKAGYSGKIK